MQQIGYPISSEMITIRKVDLRFFTFLATVILCIMRLKIVCIGGGLELESDLIAVKMAGLTGLHGEFKAKCCQIHEMFLNFTTFYLDKPYYGALKNENVVKLSSITQNYNIILKKRCYFPDLLKKITTSPH